MKPSARKMPIGQQGRQRFKVSRGAPAKKAKALLSAPLRQRAEERLRRERKGRKPSAGGQEAGGDAERVVHELHVHQIELEMQNEELRRAQHELEVSREKYFDLYDLAPVGYLTLNEPGLILEANLTAARLLGVSRTDLLQQPLTRFILREDLDIFYQHRRQLFETRAPQHCELRLTRPGGAPFWVRGEAILAQEHDIAAPVCRVALSDLTEHKQAEADRERLAQFERLAQLMKCASDIIVLTGEHGRILEANDRALETYGYSLAELRQKTLEDLRTPESRAEHSHQIEQLETDGRAVFEAMHQRRNGSAFPVEISARFLQIAGVRHRIGIVRDITERKRAEAFARLERDLGMALAAAHELDVTLRLCLEVAMRAAGMDCGGIYLKDRATGCLDMAVHAGLSAEFVENVSRCEADSPKTRLVEAGKPVYANCVHLTPPLDQAERREGLRAIAVVPIRHEERTIGCLNVASHTLNEVPAFARDAVEAIASQVGSAVARAQAEQALRASEERYRTLFEAMDEGFCVVEMLYDPDGKAVDYRFVEINPAFEKHTGLQQALGKTIRQMVPNHEAHWFEIYGKVARTGEAIRFESPAKAMQKYYDVFAFRIGGDGSQRVGILFNDITERKRTEESLCQLAQVSAASSDYIALIGPDFRYRFVNDVYLKARRLRPEEMVGHHMQEIVGPERFEQLGRPQVETCLRGEAVETFEWSDFGTGVSRFLHVKVTPFREPDGTISGAVMSGRDITERKRGEEALQASEKRLRELYVLQRLLLYPNPLEQKLKLVTEAVVRMVGADFARIWMIKPGDRCAAGCVHALVTDGPHVCRFRERCLHLLTSSGRYTRTNGDHSRVPFGCYKIGKIAAAEELKFLTNDVITDASVHNHAWAKELGLVSFAGYRLTDSDDIPLGVLALFSKQPISAEEDLLLEGIANATSLVLFSERAEAARRRAEEQCRSIFDNAVEGIYQSTPQGTFLAANPATARILGYRSPEALLRECTDIARQGYVNPHRREEFKRRIETHGVVSGFEYEAYRKDGSTVWVFENARVVRDEQGQVVCYEGTLADITERKLAEKRMQVFSQEIIAAREEERKQVSSVLHHDVGSLAVGMAAHLDAIEEDLRSGKLREAFKWMKRTRKLFDESVVRLKKLAIELRPPELDVLGLHAALRQYLSQVTERGGIRIHFRESLGRRRVSGDTATILFRVAQEAVTNAITHGHATRVDVGLTASKEEVRLTVSNNGKEFDTSGHKARAASQMGLRVMHEMAVSARGTFAIDSGRGKRTTVRVRLPLSSKPHMNRAKTI